MPAALNDGDEGRGLYRLLAWLSPNYPIGAFSYSHGLEAAIEQGFVDDAADLTGWTASIVEEGAGRNDGLLLSAAYRASLRGDDIAMDEIADLGTACQPTAELLLETTTQGRAFLDTTRAAWPAASLDRLSQVRQGRPTVLPVVVGAAAAGHVIPLAAKACT